MLADGVRQASAHIQQVDAGKDERGQTEPPQLEDWSIRSDSSWACVMMTDTPCVSLGDFMH